MPTQLFKINNYSLQNLLTDIEVGNTALPELQRPFVWSNIKVRDLFDSLYKGLPVGYLLLWEVVGSNNYRRIGRGEEQPREPRFLVIDGQQRLTSLYAIIKGKPVFDKNFDKRFVKIAFNPLQEKFEVHNAAIAKDPAWVSSITDLFLSSTPYDYISGFLNKLEQKMELSDEQRRHVKSNINKLHNILTYIFSVLELSPDLDTEEVSEVFVRINSKGQILNQSDFILTLMSVYWDEGRKELENFCEQAKTPAEDSKPSPFNYLIHPLPAQLLRTIVGHSFLRGRLRYAYLILRGKDLEDRRSDFDPKLRDKNFNKLQKSQKQVLDLTNWHDFINIISSSGFVTDSLISSQTALFVTYTLYLLAKEKLNITHKRLEHFIRRWYVFSTLTQRYTGSPESQIEQDLRIFKGGKDDVIDKFNDIIEHSLTKDYWDISLAQQLASSSTKNTGYLVFIASLLYNNKKALFSKIKLYDVIGARGVKFKKYPVETHHIFPKKYLSRQGVTETSQMNQVANYVYLEYRDNIKISDLAPKTYLNKFVKELNYSDNKLRNELSAHAMPFEFETMKYEMFLKERRKLMAKLIREYFNKL